MQISAANLLASQSQPSVRSRGAGEAFEPIAFKQTPASAVTQEKTKQSAPAATTSAPSPATSARASTAYVRPGTNLDIKI